LLQFRTLETAEPFKILGEKWRFFQISTYFFQGPTDFKLEIAILFLKFSPHALAEFIKLD
jgi:hypothetical protein